MIRYVSRTLASVTLTLGFIPFSVFAQADKDQDSPLPLTHPVAKKLLAIEDELNKVVKSRTNVDATVERYVANDWYDIGPHGDIYNRAQMISIIKNNSDRIESAEASDVIVRLYGSVAVVTALTHEIGKRVDGRDYDEPYRWTDVFHMRNGRWQIVVS